MGVYGSLMGSLREPFEASTLALPVNVGASLVFDATRATMATVSSGTKAWARTDTPPSDSLEFMSSCPGCKDVSFQQGYDFRSLVRLLVDDQPIEAYCGVCDRFWPITANERADLALLLLTDGDSRR